MALNLGAIRATLALNTQQFTSQLRNVSDAMRNAFGASAQSNINSTASAVSNLGSHLKSIERIVGGIVISQGFYRMLNQVQASSGAMFQFMNNMEKAGIAMEYFLGNAKEAEAFMYNMKDFAADTAFSTEQALDLSRRLMAAQFDPTKVRSMMEILNDASAASGGTAQQMDRIVLALTQMRTNGKIAGQELRQFAEAGIPIYQILREELGLTSKEIMNIGDLQISGDLGVQAVLSGLEKRYKGAAERIADTVPGMWESITDSIKMVGEDFFAYPYKVLEKGLTKVRDTLEEARHTVFESGFGGLFEQMFDTGTQNSIRLVAAALRSLGQSMTLLGQTAAPIVSQAFSNLSAVLGFILPILASIVRMISIAIAVIVQVVPGVNFLVAAIAGLGVAVAASKALFMLWRITGLGLIANAVAAAVVRLASAIRILMMVMIRNPIILLLTGLAGGMVYLASKTKFASNMLSGFNGLVGNLAGVDPGSIFKPVKNDAVTSVDKYGESALNAGDNLKEMSDAAKGAGKATEKAGDKAKKAAKKIKDSFTASFDELYQIPEKTEDSAAALDDLGKGIGDLGGGAGDLGLGNMPDIGAVDDGGFGMGGLDLGGLPELDTTSLFDGIKKAVDKVKKFFTDDFFGNVKNGVQKTWDWLKTNVPNLAKTIWDFTKGGALAIHEWLMQFDLYRRAFDSLKNFWAKWGDDIKGFFSNLWTIVSKLFISIWDANVEIIKESWSKLKDFWAKWGDDIIGVFENFVELVIVAVKWMWEEMKKFWEDYGPFIKGFWENLWENIKDILITALDIVLDTVGSVFGILNNLLELFINVFEGDWEGAWENIKEIFKITWDWIVNTLQSILDLIMDLFEPWIADIGKWIKGLWDDVAKWTNDKWKQILDTIKKWLVDTSTAIVKFKTDVTDRFKEMWNTVSTNVGTAWTNIKNAIKGHLDSVTDKFFVLRNNVSKILSDLWDSTKKTANSKWTDFTNMIDRVVDGIKRTFGNMKTSIVTVFDGMWTGIKKALNKIIAGVNVLIDHLNSMKITVPKVDLPGLPPFGGGTIGLPKMPRIPALATGGVIDKHMLLQAGERGKREVMIPMENPNFMRPFSSAVARDLSQMMGGLGGQSSEPPLPVVYVHTLIADDRGLRDLDKRLRVIQLEQRGGNR